MKLFNTYIFILSLFLTGCFSDNSDYVILRGTIINAPTDTIFIYDNYDNYSKSILLDEKNNFEDTLNISAAEYHLQIADKATNLFLKKGDNLEITLDYYQFDETIRAKGIGQKINNFLFKRIILREKHIYNNKAFFEKDSAIFNHDLNTFFDKEIHTLERLHLDSSIFAKEKEAINMTKKSISYFYLDMQEIKQLEKLKTAPQFSLNDQFENRVSLIDLRGKLVFIDVWATWCTPCIKEIPAFKSLQKKYENKDIYFVSISIDNLENINEWKKIIKEENMTGIQLILDNGWKSSFKTDYAISSIPRFILIDKTGKFIDVNAPRPSEKGVHELIDKYL